MNDNHTLRNIVLVLAVFVLGIVLLGIGFFVGQMVAPASVFTGGWMMGYGQESAGMRPYGMMGGNYADTDEYGYYGPGMMGRGMMGGGMMGGYDNSGLRPDEPITIEQAEQAVQEYLDQLGDPNLQLAEVMIFDNHAYAEIVEQDTGIGAMEVLVDPVSQAVYPEPGPNMMWNLKYGMMAGYGETGMFGGMMGRSFSSVTPRAVEASMPVAPGEATSEAQQYLDQYLPGAQAGSEAEAFYGYYTIHIERDGQVVGMLGVNGYNGQVFPHTWHGQFVEMSEEAH